MAVVGMPILMTAEITGFTQAMADAMNAKIGERMKTAQGFVIHANGPIENGWRVTEIWESADHFNRWYEATIRPNLPPGVQPQITTQDLYDVIKA